MSDLPLTDELPMPAAARASARAQHVAQSGGGEAMRGPITVDGRLPVLRHDVTQIAGRGNGEDLLDDVHELVQAEDIDRHWRVVTRRCLAGQITATAFPPSNGRRRASV